MFQLTVRKISAGICLFALPAALFATEPEEYLDNPLPSTWSYIPEISMDIPEATEGWWKNFSDATLDSLMAAGINNNYDIAIAARRAEMARNTMKSARGGWMPQVGLSAGWTRSRNSGMIAPPYGEASTESYFSAGLNASWEIDIFGKVASSVKAKKSSWRASRAEQAGVMLSVSAQIASTYMKLRTLQQQLSVARSHSESQMKIVNIAKARFETTLASKLDVAQAYEVYYSTTASIPMLENSIHTAINSLAVLTGMSFSEASAILSDPAPLPDYMLPVNAGVPMQLLRRRPDIAQAEMELAAYAAEIGIAKKDFLPTLTIDGSIGTAAHELGDLMHKQTLTYSVAPSISWTIFDGMQRRYALANARETMLAGIDNYNLTVANAVREADNALSTYYSSLRYVEAVQKVVDQNVEELALAVDRYKNSLSPMSDVVTAQLNSLAAENQMIEARGSALSALISLYEALGGGFNINTIQ
ncbi:MAG: efflux transporter outer membrane subunit [Muribaculaceae bacterium]|nr:efflux transporter outer membrane subunit [Muribaculaceae bacterium]